MELKGFNIYKICTEYLFGSFLVELPFIIIFINIKSPWDYKRMFITNSFFRFILLKINTCAKLSKVNKLLLFANTYCYKIFNK